MNNKGQLIVLSGPSGVGKGTLLGRCLQRNDNLRYSVSATTREPRQGEIDGKDYYFMSKEEFLSRANNGCMLEYACYNGNYYGTPRDYCEKLMNEGKDVVLEIEVQGAMQVKKMCPDAVMIFVIPPTLKELEARLQTRGTETGECVLKRLDIAKQEIRYAEKYDYVIINDDLEKAEARLDAVFLAVRCTPKSMKEFLDEVNIC
ncbi:MAG: guanylate kinase [Oscillospiraceae bacterium]